MGSKSQGTSCLWIAGILLVFGLCGFPGLGQISDRFLVTHAADYRASLFPAGLLGCLCLGVPALVLGAAAGIWRGTRPPEVTEDELRAGLEG